MYPNDARHFPGIHVVINECKKLMEMIVNNDWYRTCHQRNICPGITHLFPSVRIAVMECKAEDPNRRELDGSTPELAANLSVPLKSPSGPLAVRCNDGRVVDHLCSTPCQYTAESLRFYLTLALTTERDKRRDGGKTAGKE